MSIKDGLIPVTSIPPPYFGDHDTQEDPIKPIVDFVNQVDSVYQGLGIPTLYGVLSIIANKSVLFIGPRGSGKTRLVNLIPMIPVTLVSKWDTFTYSELSAYCKEISDSRRRVRGKDLVFKVEEFSTYSQYHRQQFLTTASKIVSDGNFRHVTKSIHIDIESCRLTMLIAIQPRIYSDLCNRYTEWDSLSYDRFTKFILLNPLRTTTSREECNPTLPEEMGHISSGDYQDLDLNCLIDLFRGHVSRGRAELFARDYVKALAEFLGADVIQQQHVELFHRLFHLYLESFSELQSAEDLDSPIIVKSSSLKLLSGIGHGLEYVLKKDLAEEFRVTERHIERAAKELAEIGLIEKPSPHAARYRLSPTFRTFFRSYRDGSLFRLMSDSQDQHTHTNMP